jgi:hypothetical protein
MEDLDLGQAKEDMERVVGSRPAYLREVWLRWTGRKMRT